MRSTRSLLSRALGLALLLAGAAPAAAAPLPRSDQPVQIVARDQPIAAFLRDLFGRIDRPVIPSANLTGTVNGSFAGSADKVFADVARAFNLVGYYDGAAVYVYAASEVKAETIPGGPAEAQRVMRTISSLRLSDARNLLRAAPDGTLVASGTPRFVEQVSEIARQNGGSANTAAALGMPSGSPLSPALPYRDTARLAEMPPQPLEFRVFYLRYARAEDTTISAGGREVRVPGLATIVRNLVLDTPVPFGAQPVPAAFGSRPLRQSQPRLKGQGLDAVPPDPISTMPVLGLPNADPAAYGQGGYGPGGYGQGGYGAPPPGYGYNGQPLPPATDETVRIQANPYLNALIIRDVPERMPAYDSLLRALDVEPQLVEIEATIIDINTNKLRELGVNWRFGSGGFGALFGSGDEDSDRRLRRRGGSRRDNLDSVTPTGRGLNLSTIIGSNREFIARVSALEAQGAARIVSRPQIMTLSNVEAVFDRTRTFYVRVAGREEVDLFNVTAGTVLRVNPHVFRDHDQTRIRVLIGIEDGNITSGEVEDIPIVERSSVSTQAMIVDGESLLLGGMTVDSDVEALDKIPLLGDIPILGELFKSRSREKGRTERLFLITPRIATLTPRLEAAAAEFRASTQPPAAPAAAQAQPLPAAAPAPQAQVWPAPAPMPAPAPVVMAAARPAPAAIPAPAAPRPPMPAAIRTTPVPALVARPASAAVPAPIRPPIASSAQPVAAPVRTPMPAPSMATGSVAQVARPAAPSVVPPPVPVPVVPAPAPVSSPSTPRPAAVAMNTAQPAAAPSPAAQEKKQ